ncbi:GDP-mannose-dependent alpha-(1-6)-phosphatidylinositol monomannoside mannosyltransferase [Mycobacterium kansasii 732]|nr:GDP-mannose-dependent alpha-(1-6)-phosphatidylinositol monomannoside mannosyltransferase [Mycobacterium kansasii 732]
MSRVLLVTNDFPPRRGGIQSYLGEFVGRLVETGSHSVTVYAPQWKGRRHTTTRLVQPAIAWCVIPAR